MSDQFDVIEPAATAATFAGKPLDIKPLKVGQLPAFARAIKPISSAVEDIATGRRVPSMETIMALIGDHGESVIAAVSIASGISVDELNDATPDQLIEVAMAALKVNADFFKGRLTPAILAAVKSSVAPTPGAGPTP
jgi:hypothetical protein